jgi:energy-converting hydrogenase Eha subunit B
MTETPISLTVTATILGLAKRPGATRDGRNILSLTAEINGTTFELNLVTKPSQGIGDALNYLANAGYLTKNSNTFVIQVPTWTLNKAKNNVVWIHIEDYEKLKGTA